MTFDRPLFLLLALIPLVWAWFEWRKTSRHAALILKTLAFLAVALAFSQPRISISQTKMAVAILVDTSASVTSADLENASAITSNIERASGRNWTKVIPFAQVTRNPADSEKSKSWQLRHTAGDGGRGTDLEAGIRQAIASMPQGHGAAHRADVGWEREPREVSRAPSIRRNS
jgi:hypothetical protein